MTDTGRLGDRMLVVVLGALLLGVFGSFELAGRTFVVSWIDLAALGVAVAGGILAWRRRALRVDPALGAYGAFLAVVLLQAALLDGTLDILGGASRVVTAALVLFALTQAPPARWEPALLGFGALLGGWVVVRLGMALADPDLTTFYAVKNAVVTPLAASNTLAGYLLVPAVAGAVLVAEERRWWPYAVLATAGVAATLSRGALAALVVALLVAAVIRPGVRRAALLAASGVVVTSAVLLLLVVPSGAAAPTPTAGAAPVLDPVDRDAVGTAPSERLSPSADGRLALWRASGRSIVEHPVLGVGLNRITEVTRDLRQPHDHAHNLFLHALAESGLLGAAAYLAIWGALVRRLRHATPSPRRTAIAGGALALALHAQVEALTYQRGIEVVLAILLVLAGALASERAGGVRTWATATLAGSAPPRRSRRVR